jgi:two-component system, cell cycle sensor histidine kinase and response regulator CckA
MNHAAESSSIETSSSGARRLLRLAGPSANDPAARIFHTLLLAYLAWTTWELALVPFVAVRKATVALMQVTLMLMLVVSLYLLRKGFSRPATFVYLFGSGVLNFITMVFGGGLRGPAVAIYTLLPISAAWLLGYRAMIWATALFLGSSLLMTVFDLKGILPAPYFPTPGFAAWFVTVEAVMVGVVPVAQMLKILKERLEQSEADRAALQESEGRFRAVANAAPLMIWTAGPDMRCTFVNKAWLDFTGRTPEEELGDGWTVNVHPDDVPLRRATYKDACDARRNIELEFRQRGADGEYRWVLGNGVPRFATNGQFIGYIGTVIDVTDLKHRRDEDAVRQKLENVGSLAAGIAHDFNNILGAILAQADLGLAEVAASVLPEDELESIRAVAIRGTGIGRQLMVYAGQESAINEPVDVSNLIDDMRELLKVAVSKHAVLTTELAREMPLVLANPAQLRQVVMNLVTNASEAIGERDGRILIRTRQVTAVVNSTLGGLSQCIELEISDTGSGINRETQSKIFDPFFTTKSAGHGLGLAVVQRIIQELGGAMEVDTELGRGTTFRILLPIAEKARPMRQATASVLRGELMSDVTVLLVEDESSLRVAVARILRSKGLRVVEAANGTEALASIHEHKDEIALVLLDVTLPGAPSRDLLTEARRVREDVKIIVVSAYGQNTVDASFPGMRIDAFLRKPYTLAELMSLMARVLSGEGTQADAKANTN